jgi:hypothetical protein
MKSIYDSTAFENVDYVYRAKALWCLCTDVQRIIHNGCKRDQLEKWAENLPKTWDSINPD